MAQRDVSISAGLVEQRLRRLADNGVNLGLFSEPHIASKLRFNDCRIRENYG